MSVRTETGIYRKARRDPTGLMHVQFVYMRLPSTIASVHFFLIFYPSPKQSVIYLGNSHNPSKHLIKMFFTLSVILLKYPIASFLFHTKSSIFWFPFNLLQSCDWYAQSHQRLCAFTSPSRNSRFHRITEYSDLEGTQKDHLTIIFMGF